MVSVNSVFIDIENIEIVSDDETLEETWQDGLEGQALDIVKSEVIVRGAGEDVYPASSRQLCHSEVRLLTRTAGINDLREQIRLQQEEQEYYLDVHPGLYN